jgi:WD40 repeat protein
MNETLSEKAWSVAFSPDDRSLASVADDGKLMLWDATTGARRCHIVATREQGRLRRLQSRRANRRLRRIRWTERPQLSGYRLESIVRGRRRNPLAAYSADGSHLTLGLAGGLIKTWDVASGDLVQIRSGHSMNDLGLAFSPDGRLLASAGQDGTVRDWDTQTGQELLCLTDCKARVNSVAFSPNGSILAAADHSGAVTLWRTRPTR